MAVLQAPMASILSALLLLSGQICKSTSNWLHQAPDALHKAITLEASACGASKSKRGSVPSVSYLGTCKVLSPVRLKASLYRMSYKLDALYGFRCRSVDCAWSCISASV